MRAAYAAAMERLYLACIVVSATALVAITLVIPYGVFMRYVMNSASSWPEPFSVLAMVLFSFVGGAAAYRANVHICVQMLTEAVNPAGCSHGEPRTYLVSSMRLSSAAYFAPYLSRIGCVAL